jgi:hypothetical protein
MWTCPSCGRSFASRNQSHACAALVLAEKTRIALQVRMSFAAFMPRRDWLNGHMALAQRIDSPRFLRVETFSPRNVVHAFRLSGPDEVDPEFAAWLAEAYRVGAQEHLQRPRLFDGDRVGGRADPARRVQRRADQEHLVDAVGGT